MTTTVVDLSHYNPEPNWDRLKAGPIMGVILKATEGTGYVDPTYVSRRREAEAVGLPVVAYHFLKGQNVGLQTIHFLETVNPVKGERLIIDYEDAGTSLDDLETMVSTLLGLALDLQVTVYGGGKLKGDLGNAKSATLAKTSLWLAQYGSNPSWPTAVWPNWTLWQTTDKAQVAGISAPVDGSVFNGTNENLVKWLRPAKSAVSPPPPAPEPIPGPVPPPIPATISIHITKTPGVALDVWLNGVRL